MSTSKSKLKAVIRQHFPQSMLLLSKSVDAKASVVPTRAAAGTSAASECTTLIADLPIYANMVDNVVPSDKTETGLTMLRWKGGEFVDRLMRNVNDAFAQGYDTVVLVLDKAAWTTEAKMYTQKKRSVQQIERCSRLGLKPLDWDSNAPTRIIDYDRVLPPLCTVRATRSAFRYALYQAMKLVLVHYAPPPNCRLIIDMQPYDATNPECVDDWLANNEQIRVPRKYCQEVDALREQLRAIEHLPTWRAAARKLATELARAGKVRALPWCIECTADNVPVKPFVLARCYNTAGEADLGIWRWVSMLYPANKERYLGGTRELATIAFDGSNARFYTQAQRDAARVAADGFRNTNVYMGRGGVDAPQRALVASSDSDFISFGMLAYARSLCDFIFNREPMPNQFTLIDALARSAPLINFGDAYTTTLGRAPNACVYGTKGEAKAGRRVLHRVHELLDVAHFFDSLVFNRHPPPTMRDSDQHRALLAEEAEAIEAAKRTRKRKPTLKSRKAHEPSRFPTLALTPLSVEFDGPRAWLERALTFAVFCAICGNDYLRGLTGVSHATMYCALAQYLESHPREPLVVLSDAVARPGETQIPGVSAQPSRRTLLVHPGRYTRFLAYCYHTHLCNSTGANVPELPPARMSYAQVSAVVCHKYRSGTANHMPDDETLALMYERTMWCIYYAFYGPFAIARTLDAPQVGWPLGLRATCV